MPLHAGSSKKVTRENMSEMMHSATFAEGKPRKKKQQMAVAAAYSKAGKSRGKKKRARSLAKDAMHK